MSDYNNKDRNYKIFFQNKLFNVSNLSTSHHRMYLIATLSFTQALTVRFISCSETCWVF